jgi:hypothetical protein
VSTQILAKLEQAMTDTSDVFIGRDIDAEEYLSGLANDLRAHVCAPFAISAKVMAPGFPGMAIGDIISGQCVAHRLGYWLVYQPELDRFTCFWGESQSNLGARGVFGSPLYCWSA